MNNELLTKLNLIGEKLGAWDKGKQPSIPTQATAVDLRQVAFKLDLLGASLNVFKIVRIATVVKRLHTSDKDGAQVPVIDFYPPWSEAGYGIYRECLEYMDHDWQVNRFEKFSGLNIADLPIYDSTMALKRTYGQRHECEVNTDFYLLLQMPEKEKEKTRIIQYYDSVTYTPLSNKTPAVDRQYVSEEDSKRLKIAYWRLLSEKEKEVFKGLSILEALAGYDTALEALAGYDTAESLLNKLWGDRDRKLLKEGDTFVVGHNRVALFRSANYVYEAMECGTQTQEHALEIGRTLLSDWLI